MSSIRVMATCSLLGEAVGKAASVAVHNNCTPHQVYLDHIKKVQDLLLAEDSFLPSLTRKISPKCQFAKLIGADESIRNGQDRAHRIYGTNDDGYFKAKLNDPIVYSFNASVVESVHLTFDSDLNRKTLPGSSCERTHSTRANRKLTAPQMKMPSTLCREFELYGELDGEKVLLLSVLDNTKRSYDVKIDKKLDKLWLVPKSTWDECAQTAAIISFDFK